MDSIAAAQPLLDRQEHLAIWYAAYDGAEEAVRYANPVFCDTFGLSLTEVLKRRRYHLVNPPETSAETIAQYKAEDREAMDHGHFLQRSPIETGKDIVVLKIRFDYGILGMFKFVASSGPTNAPSELDADFQSVLKLLGSNLLDSG